MLGWKKSFQLGTINLLVITMNSQKINQRESFWQGELEQLEEVKQLEKHQARIKEVQSEVQTSLLPKISEMRWIQQIWIQLMTSKILKQVLKNKIWISRILIFRTNEKIKNYLRMILKMNPLTRITGQTSLRKCSIKIMKNNIILAVQDLARQKITKQLEWYLLVFKRFSMKRKNS